jgi:hypothetical protein
MTARIIAQRWRRRTAALAGVCSVLVGGTAEASLIWFADATKAPAEIFKNLDGVGNCGPTSGSITPVTDPEHANVFRYDKPASSRRCENHGVRVAGVPYVFQNNTTVYLGWWSKLSSTGNNNANFQWKSYENHAQNFPVVLKMIGGQMSLMYTPPGGGSTIIWRHPLQANSWNHFVLGLKLSSELRGGTIELWFNGMKQMLSGGMDRYAARTWDSGNHNCPKWGVYGGEGATMSNTVAEQKIGTAYEDVAMGSANPAAGASAGDGGSTLVAEAGVAPDGGAADSGDSGDSGGAAGAGGSGPLPTGGRGGSTGSSAGGSGSGEPVPGDPTGPARRPPSGGCQLAGSAGGTSFWIAMAALALMIRRRRTKGHCSGA